MALSKDPRMGSAILQSAPDKWLKTIWLAVLNSEPADSTVNKGQRKAFKKHRKAISKLLIRKFSFGRKMNFLNQTCGAEWEHKDLVIAKLGE